MASFAQSHAPRFCSGEIMKSTRRRWVNQLRCGAGLAGSEREGTASFSNAVHVRIQIAQSRLEGCRISAGYLRESSATHSFEMIQ